MNFHREPHTYVGQVDLNVLDLQRSLSFYQHMIGFQILEQSERSAVLTADGKTPLLSIQQPEGVLSKQPRTTGLYHFAILLPSRSDLGKVLQHLLQNNYPLQGASDHLVSEALYLGDPDGNGIEIYIDRDPSTWKWNKDEVAMAVDPLDSESLLAEAKGKTWKGLPPETVMGHLHLHVSELGKTEQFYVKGLGFDVVNRYSSQALFVSTGRYHHHIGLNTWAGVGAPPPPENSVGINWFSIVFPNETARKEKIENLKAIGASVYEENGVVVTSDPSGNRIHLII